MSLTGIGTHLFMRRCHLYMSSQQTYQCSPQIDLGPANGRGQVTSSWNVMLCPFVHRSLHVPLSSLPFVGVNARKQTTSAELQWGSFFGPSSALVAAMAAVEVAQPKRH